MDGLDYYLDQIGDIPVLAREEQLALGRGVVRARRRFCVAVSLHPRVAPLLLARWRARVERGLSVEPLVEAFRGPGGAERARHFHERMQRLETKVATGASRRAQARDILASQPAFEVLEALGREAADTTGDDDPEAVALRRHARRAHRRYLELRGRLAWHNLRLVIAFAKRFRHRGVDFLDLIQEGNQALLRAVEKFDPRRGLGFASYASWWIEQAMVRALQTQAEGVRRPTHAHQLRRAFLDGERVLRCSAPGEPTRDDVAGTLEMGERQRRTLDATLARIASADQPAGPASPVTIGATLTDPAQTPVCDTAGERELARRVASEIAALPPRTRRILEWRFGLLDDDDRSLAEIGRELGLTRERVRQIERGALRTLRERTGVRSLARDLGIELDEDGGGER